MSTAKVVEASSGCLAHGPLRGGKCGSDRPSHLPTAYSFPRPVDAFTSFRISSPPTPGHHRPDRRACPSACSPDRPILRPLRALSMVYLTPGHWRPRRTIHDVARGEARCGPTYSQSSSISSCGGAPGGGENQASLPTVLDGHPRRPGLHAPGPPRLPCVTRLCPAPEQGRQPTGSSSREI